MALFIYKTTHPDQDEPETRLSKIDANKMRMSEKFSSETRVLVPGLLSFTVGGIKKLMNFFCFYALGYIVSRHSSVEYIVSSKSRIKQ